MKINYVKGIMHCTYMFSHIK